MAEKKRRARSEGSVRQRKDGTWEARFVTGIDPGTGKEIRKSVYAKTQKEVRQKLAQAIAEIDSGTYQVPNKMTVGQWLDIWVAEYLNHVRPRTVEAYQCQIKNHIRPALGAVKLDTLTTPTIQSFYNAMSQPNGDKPGLSAKSIKNVHGILHKALQQAVTVGYLRFNPADACTLPRVEHKELKPLDETDTARFIEAVKGHRYETLFLVTLFTGMREGEVLGLTWDCVDFKRGTVTVNKQLQKLLLAGVFMCWFPPRTERAALSLLLPMSWICCVLKSDSRPNGD